MEQSTENLIREQTSFIDDKAQLELWLIRNGYYICPGELRRDNTPLPCPHCKEKSTRQEQLIEAGRSWSSKSRHLDGLAQDYTLFKCNKDNRMEQISKEEYFVVGRFWESMNVKNVHNLKKGDDTNNTDVYHFERRI